MEAKPVCTAGRSGGISRREFVGKCAACAGACGLTALASSCVSPAGGGRKVKVGLIFSHVPPEQPTWPNIGYDYEGRKKLLAETLKRGCPGVEFVPVTARNGGEVRKALDTVGPADGYLSYMLGIWTGVARALAAEGKPTLFVDDLYGGSGEFLTAYAAERRAGRKLVGISSSRLDDVVRAARCFAVLGKPGATADDFVKTCEAARRKGFGRPGDLRCPEDPVKTVDVGTWQGKMKDSVMLVVGGARDNREITGTFGTRIVPVSFQEMDAAYGAANREEGKQFADRWIGKAGKVVEPSREEIERSGAMYVAMRDLLKKHNAGGITINCLGGFYGGHIKAYPCMGFCQLNDDGLVGACEADLNSTLTMMAVSALTGRPGYISDPVFDTSKNQIIYAHCVAPTKVYGPEGPMNPYHIRSHSEDRKGACLRSLLPLGKLTTTLEIHASKKKVLIHTAKTVDNIDEDKACRTKLAAEPLGDLDKLMTFYDRWGWHRVTFYGDLRPAVTEMCKAIGFELVEEA